MLPYGEAHRRQRAYLHQFFQTSETLNYLEVQEQECHIMLNGILNAPENYEGHVRRQVYFRDFTRQRLLTRMIAFLVRLS